MKTWVLVCVGLLVIASLALCQDEDPATNELQAELNDSPAMSRMRRGAEGGEEGGEEGGKGKGKGKGRGRGRGKGKKGKGKSSEEGTDSD